MITGTLRDVMAATASRYAGHTGGLLMQAATHGYVRVDGQVLVNMASSDYLGLARHPQVLVAAREALSEWGLGTAATRVLSGSTTVHRELERRVAAWVGCDDAILYGSCWTANAAILGGLATFAGQAGTSLAVFSDRLNHASIIDGIRAQRRALSHLGLYTHQDLTELHQQLLAQPADVVKVIVTDGVFSMEGDQAPLAALCELAAQEGALLVVDDSHGIGVAGGTGRGTAEAQHVLGAIDVVIGTLGKALGGAIGGFVASSTDLVAALRGTSRPYVFSNNPPVPVVAGALAALQILEATREPLLVLRDRVRRMRDGVSELGLRTHVGDHPIVPILIGDETRTASCSESLFRSGIFAASLAFPIVPHGEARLRLQVSAAHSDEAIDQVLAALACET